MRARRSMGPSPPLVAVATLVLLVAAGCATTRVSAVWTEETWRGGPFRKLLVIGVSDNETSRRLFESEVASQLRARGAEGVPAFSLDLPPGPVDQEAISRAYHRGWYPYWATSYEYVTRPGYTVTEETVVVETLTGDLAARRLI